LNLASRIAARLRERALVVGLSPSDNMERMAAEDRAVASLVEATTAIYGKQREPMDAALRALAQALNLPDIVAEP